MSRIPLPASLKRRVIPAWNALVHGSRRLLEVVGALRHGRFGRCEVCGRGSLWLYRRRVVAPELERRWGLTPRLADALALKESLDCVFCGAKLRARRLGKVMLELYPVGEPPAPSRSIRDWVVDQGNRVLRVAEINRVDGLHDVLTRLPNLAFSDFEPGAAPGALVGGIRSEDLTSLTYPDASLDLVITSESLEHVPDLASALREIRRVLVPGGRHVFTIPILPGVPTTFARTTLAKDGTPTHHAEEIRHPGGDWGYPVFTEFGADVAEILAGAGFEVDVRFGPPTEDDLAQVFVCRKPAGS